MSASRDLCTGGCLALVALAAYCFALPPSYAFWDTGELQTVASVFGIEHPPGSPAFIVLAWLFAHGIPVGEMAWRVNVFSAAAVATSVGVLYLTMREFPIARSTAGLCTLGFAFSAITLVYATRAEVHDLALCFSACALYFVIRYERGGRTADLFACALAAGALAATHGVALFLVPALALVVAFGRRPSRAALAAFAAGLALGLSPYAYIVPRSAWLAAHRIDPTLGLGLPPGAPFWNYGDPSTPLAFWLFVTGAQYHVHSGFAGYADLSHFGGYASALLRRLSTAYGYVGTVLALVGAALLAVRRGFAGKALVLAALLPVPYTESYSDLQDPDRYYLLALFCAAIAIALAFERTVRSFAPSSGRIVRLGMTLGLAVVFVVAAPDRGRIAAQRFDRSAPDYVAYVRSVTPDDAVVLAEWAYSSPLAYAAYVDRAFGHRTAVSAGPTQFLKYYDRWLAAHKPLYLVSFDDDLHLPGHSLARVSTDKSYFVYRVVNR